MNIFLGGQIQVTVANEDEPFLVATDPNPFTVNFLSFSSWGASEGKLFFDCHFDDRMLYFV